VFLATTLALIVALTERFWKQSHPPSFGMTVAIADEHTVVQASLPIELVPGSRVIGSGAMAQDIAAEQRHWVESGRVPVIGELGHSNIVGDALLDLNTLSYLYGVPVAGWEPAWRYVWPRDSALVASALARSRHASDAYEILDFLQRVQTPTGIFETRYLPDGSGPPDDRGTQLDGTGWALWALSQVVNEESTSSKRLKAIGRYSQLLDRSSSTLLALTNNGSSLPPVSADYWETRESKVTLATCATVLMGLRSSQELYTRLGSPQSIEIEEASDRFERLVLHAFGSGGFPRHVGGAGRSVDMGVALLLPPFANVSDPQVYAAWRRSIMYMSRPGGGLAPGGSWRRDGISWTAITSMYAVVEACHGMRYESIARLKWLDSHRTPLGSLPEKVRADGTPASVAPLGWTSAAVIYAVDVLQRGCTKPAATAGN
jgi:glucoamylase